MFEDLIKMERKSWSTKEIHNMYDEIHSEVHYDTDDIAMIICDKIIDRDKMFSNEEYYRFIYDVYYCCIKYTAKLNIIEDKRFLSKKEKNYGTV